MTRTGFIFGFEPTAREQSSSTSDAHEVNNRRPESMQALQNDRRPGGELREHAVGGRSERASARRTRRHG